MSILRQVEYYFSDSSFPFDDFLKKLASVEGKDGFVDLSVIMGFGKMKSLCGEGATEEAIAVQLEASDVLVLNPAKTGVKRARPAPLEDPALARTVVAGQFMDSDEERGGVAAKFSGFGAEVEGVTHTRNYASDERPFDGECMVVFAEGAGGEAAAQAAVEAGGKGELLNGRGEKVSVRSLATYFDELSKKRNGMKKKREGDGGGDGSSKKRKFEAPPFDEDFARGLVLSLKGLEGHGWDREAIKKGCEAHGPVGWVEYERDGSEALVRFNEAPAAKAAAEQGVAIQAEAAAEAEKEGEGEAADKEGASKAAGEAVKGQVLEGDDERAYWLRKHEDTIKRNQSKGGKGGKGGKGRRGGKGKRR